LKPEQYACVKTNAEIKGYISLSAYVRDKLFKLSHITERRLIEISQKLKERSR